MTFSVPKCLRATEAAMPMVPACFGSSFTQRGYDRVKRIECRKIDDIAWIGKTGVRSHHQHDHAAHGDIQQKQQPCRCMIASAFQFRSATAIANDQICPQTSQYQIIDRHGEKPYRGIVDGSHDAEHHIEKVDRNPLIDADASAKSKVFEVVSRNRRCSSFCRSFLARPTAYCSLISLASSMIS